MYVKYFKRVFDYSIAVLLSIVISPALFLIWILVKREEPEANAIFKQIRCGKNKTPFLLYKFRSLKSSAPQNLSTKDFIDSDKYMSNLGRLLRCTSLDELPQLFNIIKGEMSFIGPRPVIYDETNLTQLREEMGILTVLPGITGYAQIKGRDTLDTEEKVILDKYYVDNLSFMMDLKVLLQTIPSVLGMKGHKDVNK